MRRKNRRVRRESKKKTKEEEKEQVNDNEDKAVATKVFTIFFLLKMNNCGKKNKKRQMKALIYNSLICII